MLGNHEKYDRASAPRIFELIQYLATFHKIRCLFCEREVDFPGARVESFPLWEIRHDVLLTKKAVRIVCRPLRRSQINQAANSRAMPICATGKVCPMSGYKRKVSREPPRDLFRHHRPCPPGSEKHCRYLQGYRRHWRDCIRGIRNPQQNVECPSLER
jgi:hypothetical protein